MQHGREETRAGAAAGAAVLTAAAVAACSSGSTSASVARGKSEATPRPRNRSRVTTSAPASFDGTALRPFPPSPSHAAPSASGRAASHISTPSTPGWLTTSRGAGRVRSPPSSTSTAWPTAIRSAARGRGGTASAATLRPTPQSKMGSPSSRGGACDSCCSPEIGMAIDKAPSRRPSICEEQSSTGRQTTTRRPRRRPRRGAEVTACASSAPSAPPHPHITGEHVERRAGGRTPSLRPPVATATSGSRIVVLT
jgi:hypothetical protein